MTELNHREQLDDDLGEIDESRGSGRRQHTTRRKKKLRDPEKIRRLREMMDQTAQEGQTAVIEPLPTEQADEANLEEVEVQIDDALRPVRERFQAALLKLAGTTEGSLEANQRVVSRINDIANRLRVMFRCTKEGCGQAAKLRCKPVARMKTGSFQFEHFDGDKLVNHGAGAVFPRLTISSESVAQQSEA